MSSIYILHLNFSIILSSCRDCGYQCIFIKLICPSGTWLDAKICSLNCIQSTQNFVIKLVGS